MEFIKGYKTYIIAALGALISVVNMINGDLTLVEFIQSDNVVLLLNSLAMATVRHGISSNK
jgi:hypothetical protein